MNKKAAELSLNTIIIAIILIVVLIVLLLIFSGYGSKLLNSFKEIITSTLSLAKETQIPK
jgi:uncharacterized protein YpmB